MCCNQLTYLFNKKIGRKCRQGNDLAGKKLVGKRPSGEKTQRVKGRRRKDLAGKNGRGKDRWGKDRWGRYQSTPVNLAKLHSLQFPSFLNHNIA